jgi:hypothetical protein
MIKAMSIPIREVRGKSGTLRILRPDFDERRTGFFTVKRRRTRRGFPIASLSAEKIAE